MTNAVLGKATVIIDGDDSKLDKSLQGAKSKAEGLGAVLKTSLGTAAGFAGAQLGIQGISGAFDFAIGNAANFEQSLNAVKAATGATSEDMDKMRGLALKIGADTSKSASEAVLAMGELAKAGMKTTDIMNGGAMAAVNLAEATGIDVPAAAILVSNSLNTWSDAGYSASGVANILATAANASAIDVNDLGMSLSAVGPVAASAGLSMHDFAITMGLMGNNAMRGSDAGTSLKAMIAGFTPVSDKAKDSMRDLGFSAFDAEGNFKSMKDIIGNLQGSMEGLTEQQKAATLELWFGSDGVRAANILLKEGVQGWNEFGEAMDVAPDIAEQSRIRMQGLNGQIEMLKGSLETVSIVLGTLFVGAAAGAIGKITELVNAIIPLVKAFFDLGATKAAIAGLGAVFDAIPQEVIEGVAIALGMLGAKIVIAGIIAATVALWGMVAAFVAANLATIGWVIAIAAVAAAVLYAIKHWDDIKAAATSAVMAIYNTVMKYLPLIALAFGPIGLLVAFVIKNFGEIKDAITGALTSVVDFVTSTWETIKSAFNSAVDAILNYVEGHWKLLLVLFTGPLGLLIIAIVNHFETIKGAIQSALDFILNSIVTPVWNAIKTAIETVVGAIATYVTTSWNQLKADVQAIWDAISSAASAAWQAVYDFVAPKVQAVYDFVTDLFNQLKDKVVGVAQDIEAEVSAAFSSVALKAEEAWNYLKDRVSEAIEAAYNFIKPIVDKISALGDKVMGVVDKVKGAVGSVTGAAGSVGGAVGDGFNSVFGSSGWTGATGGRPPVGVPGIVGEKGWELWVPDRPGTILNHEDSQAALEGLGGGSGIQVMMPNAVINARDEREAWESTQMVGYGIQTAAALRGRRR